MKIGICQKAALMMLGISLCVSHARAAQEVRHFECSGAISGRITVSTFAPREPYEKTFPRTSAVSRLVINGRTVTLNCSANQSYWKQDIWGGAWEYDYSRKDISLCGANLHLNVYRDGLHLELGGWGGAVGYLGHRDHDAGPYIDNRYDFSCAESFVQN